jgi:transposase-like protein
MIKRTRDEWKEIVKQWKASGKTMAAWCHEHEIPKSTFIYWVKGRAPQKTIPNKALLERCC